MSIVERIRAAQQEQERQQKLEAERETERERREKEIAAKQRAEEERRFREIVKRNEKALDLTEAKNILGEINKKLLGGRGIVIAEPTKRMTHEHRDWQRIGYDYDWDEWEHTQEFANVRLEIPTRFRGLFHIPDECDRLALIAEEGREVIIHRDCVEAKPKEFNPCLYVKGHIVGKVEIPQNLEDKSAIDKLKSKIEDLIIKTVSERPLGKK